MPRGVRFCRTVRLIRDVRNNPTLILSQASHKFAICSNANNHNCDHLQPTNTTTMKLSALSIIVPLAMPLMSAAWMMDQSPFFSYGIIRPTISPLRILREQQALANRAAKEWNCRPSRSRMINKPRYELKDEDNKFAVALDLPGVSPQDITISYEDDSKLLSITGRREFSNERGSYSERFSQSFYLDPSVDTEKIAANLENGVLVVSAPKDYKKFENNVRTIPIAAPSDTTSQQVDVEDASTEASPVSDGNPKLEDELNTEADKPLDDGETFDLDSNEDF